MTEELKVYANYLRVYTPFMQQLTECKQNEWFCEVVKELESNPMAKWQPLESFLIQPIQRIPRYPMMLKVSGKYLLHLHPHSCPHLTVIHLIDWLLLLLLLFDRAGVAESH